MAVRPGLRYIHGLGEAWPRRIVKRREETGLSRTCGIITNTRACPNWG
jgi:hypothetical protein